VDLSPRDPVRPSATGTRRTPAPGVVDRISQENVPAAPSVRLTPDALGSLASHGFSEEEITTLVVPKRTLARRRAAREPLTVEETDKAFRLDRVAAQAERTFGDAAKAQRWLRKPKRELNGCSPLDFLASESGARLVEDMLTRIEHGMFA
jgi:putative toxin-antitoxin system antitoxin component (TIGR02293 family)